MCVPTPTITLGALSVPLRVPGALALGALLPSPTPTPHTEVGATFPWVFIAWQALGPLVSQRDTYRGNKESRAFRAKLFETPVPSSAQPGPGPRWWRWGGGPALPEVLVLPLPELEDGIWSSESTPWSLSLSSWGDHQSLCHPCWEEAGGGASPGWVGQGYC